VGTLTVRLSAEDEALVARLARQNGASKSETVRELVRSAHTRAGRQSKLSAYDLLKDGIGCWDSGGMNLSERTGDTFYKMLVEDRKRRDSRRHRTARRTNRSK
jgi:hypothetical protein